MKDNALWKLPQLLKDENITPYKLHKLMNEGDRSAAQGTIYRWSRELPDTLDVTLLMGIIEVLRALTEKNIQVNDLILYRK